MNDEELRRLLRRSDGPVVIRPLHARSRLAFGKLAAIMSTGALAVVVSLVIGVALGGWRDQGRRDGEPQAAAPAIDPSRGSELLAEIPLEHVPTSVAVVPFENRLFVADRDGGLSVFDTATNRLVNRVVLPLSGPVPAKITVIPSTKRVYVTDFSGDRVLVIDGSTLGLIATVPTGRAPTAITSDAKANRIYVANLGFQSARASDSVPGSVTVIDGGGSVLATVPTRGHPITLDVSPGIDSNRLYVGALGLPGEPSFIQVIDTFTRTEVASVGVAAPLALVADPVDNAVYAVTAVQAPGSKLIELDARTNVAATSVVDSPGDARAIGWHPGSDERYRRVYVASQTDLGGVLHIYRALPGTIRLSEVGAVRVGAEPVALAVDGASHRVYVASAGAKTISVVLQGPELTTPAIPKCPPGQLPNLDVAGPPPLGPVAGSGSPNAEAAFRKARPDATSFAMYPLGSDQPVQSANGLGRGPVWIVAGSETYIAMILGQPDGSNWFAYPARFAGCRSGAVVPAATPTFTVTARPGCARVETGDIQACPGSGPIGTTLTVSGRNWSCTVPGARVDLVFVGNEGEGIATGAVGGFSFPPVQPDANGDWTVTVRIPATLDPDKGQGGGPTTPGIYRILSKPAYCAADFTVVR